MRCNTAVLLTLTTAVGCSESPTEPIDLQVSSAFDAGVDPLSRTRLPTAVGGTQRFLLRYPRTGSDQGAPFDRPFELTIDGDSCTVEDQRDSGFTLRGHREGTCSIAIVAEDGVSYDTESFRVVAIASIVLEPVVPGGVAKGPLAWWTGDHRFGVTPKSAGEAEAIADASIEISLAGAAVSPPGNGTTRVDVEKPVGTHAISIVAGGTPWTADYVVTDRVDSIVIVPRSPNDPIPTSVKRGSTAGATVCFQARFGDRTILQPPLVMAAVGVQVSHAEPVQAASINAMCIAVTTDESAGDLTFEARLAGKSISLTLPVVP